jgi:MerR family transcriptional regulator, light-induced transcriptional regulator
MVREDTYTRFLSALVAGRKGECVEIFESLLTTADTFIGIYEDLIRRALYDVGLMWESNRISVATEHLAAAIAEHLMGRLYDRLTPQVDAIGTVVVACPQRELHQIGAKMVSDVFESNGWNTVFAGANVPLEDLLRLLGESRPHFCALSLSLYMNLPGFLATTESIRSKFPSLPVLVGGQAFQRAGSLLNFPAGIIHCPSLRILDDFLKRDVPLPEQLGSKTEKEQRS